MAVVRDVTDQSIAAKARSNLREQLSDMTPEKRTVTEKREVKRTPDKRPYLLLVKSGMSIDIM